MAKRTGGAGGKRAKSTNGKAYLTRDELLERLRPRTEEYEVPAVVGGGVIVLRALTAKEGMDNLQLQKGESEIDRVKRLIHMAIVEPALTLDDIAELDSCTAGFIQQIGDRILSLSGYNVASIDAFLALIQQQNTSTSSASKS